METTEQQRLQDCPERSPNHSLAGDQGLCLQLAPLTALWDLEQRQAETVSLSPFPGPLIMLPPWSASPTSVPSPQAEFITEDGPQLSLNMDQTVTWTHMCSEKSPS